MTIESAQDEMALCEAAASAAQRIVDEATAAIQAAQDAVAEITSEIEDHDGGAGIEVLAAQRATAVARTEALSKRLAAKRRALAESQEEVKRASLVLAEFQLAAERQRVAELDAELKAQIEAAARSADAARLEIQGHLLSALAAGEQIANSRGDANSQDVFVFSIFGSVDTLVEVFAAAIEELDGVRRLAVVRERQARAVATTETPAEAAAPVEGTNRVDDALLAEREG